MHSTELQYCEQAVPNILHAVAICLAASDPFVLGPMDGQTFTSTAVTAKPRSATDEPAASFYIVYGLAFESLVRAMGDTSTSAMAQVCLTAISSLVKPELCGNVLEGALFDELCTVCYRIALGEGPGVKADMCEVMKSFVLSRHALQE